MSTLLKTILLVFSELLQWLFPLSDDEKKIKNLSTHTFLEKLQVRTKNNVVVLAHYQDPEMRAAIHLVKFHHHPQALNLTSTLLTAWLQAHTSEPTIIIPIPLSKKRLRSRGFNQTEIIAAQAIKHLTTVTIRTDILNRPKETAPQTSLPKTERLQNVKDAFGLQQKINLADVHVILFDDVMTTGATLRAAKASLLPLHPKSLTCLALAH